VRPEDTIDAKLVPIPVNAALILLPKAAEVVLVSALGPTASTFVVSEKFGFVGNILINLLFYINISF
jgi:hypothetical protein